MPTFSAPFEPREFWACIFGSDRPVSIEIGPGRGDFLLAVARENPDRNYFAIERSRSSARMVEARLRKHRGDNARLLNADARFVLPVIPAASVSTYHVQFPDPWWKRRHWPRRIFTARFVAEVRRTLVPGGSIEFVTDVEEYFRLGLAELGSDPGLEVVAVGPRQTAWTCFSRKALRQGRPIFASEYRRRSPDIETSAVRAPG